MPFVRQRYGKANVRVLRVQRETQHHEVREVRVTVILDGDFGRAYTAADNASVVPTDTIKNLVNVLALEHLETANESFALAIGQRFLDRYAQVSEARVEIDETAWSRMRIDDRPHQHSFVQREGGTPFARVAITRSSREIEAGFRDFAIMKTTESGFIDYLQDEYTTLPPTTDRILATRMAATWRFEGGALGEHGDYAAVAGAIREALLRSSRPPTATRCRTASTAWERPLWLSFPASGRSRCPCPTSTICRSISLGSGRTLAARCSCPPMSRAVRSK